MDTIVITIGFYSILLFLVTRINFFFFLFLEEKLNCVYTLFEQLIKRSIFNQLDSMLSAHFET